MWRFGQTQQQQSAKSDLLQDALTSQQLRSQANHEAEHGEATIPGFRNRNKAEAGSGISHWRLGPWHHCNGM